MSSSSCSVSARSTPAWRNSASMTASLPASAAVCDAAARAPARLRPLRMARIGFERATRPATRANLRGLPNDSRYSSTTSVSGSSSQNSSRSFDETSALLPIDTNADRPRPRCSDCSSSARPSAPLCDEKATRPAGNARRANVALRRFPVDAMPRQFGPIRRAPWARTSASSSSWRATPSVPVSANPAETTHSARIPARSAERAASITCSPGTQITASSTGSGISPTEVNAWMPPTGAPARLTGYAVPSKSPAITLRNNSPPIVPRRAEAPITATERGRKKSSSDAATAE